MKKTVEQIIDRLEKEADRIERIGGKEDKKGPAGRRLHVIMGAHQAAQSMRTIIAWIKEETDLG